MSQQKKQGLSQLASMLELYLQQEVTDLEVTSALPPSCQEPLSLIAKVGKMSFVIHELFIRIGHNHCDANHCDHILT